MVLTAPLHLQNAADEHGVTPQDYVRFARGIEVSVNKYRPEILHESFDLDELMERAFDGIEAPAELQEEFGVGVRGSFRFAEEVCKAVQLDGSYKLLSVYQKGDEIRARYRMLTDGGLNYHEMKLESSRGGGIRVTDCFRYVNGENMSDTLRRQYLQVVAAADSDALHKLFGKEVELLEHADEVLRIQDQLLNGRFQTALRLYDALPKRLQNEKSMLLVCIRLCQYIDEKRYIKTLEKYRELYPTDAGIDLVMIDYYLAKDDYDAALTALERVEKRVVRDPYLDCMRGNVLVMKGEHDRAKTYFRRAIDNEPALEQAYWSFLDLALVEQDFEEMARLFSGLADQCAVDIGVLAEIDIFEPFARSKVYVEWVAKRFSAK